MPVVCGSANLPNIFRILLIAIVYSLFCSFIWICVTETTLVINHSRNNNVNETWISCGCEVLSTNSAGYSVQYILPNTNGTVIKSTVTAPKPPKADTYSARDNTSCVVDPKDNSHVYFETWLGTLLQEYKQSMIRTPFFILAIVTTFSIGVCFTFYVSSIACCQSTSRIENIIANKLRHNALLASVDLARPTNQDATQELPEDYFNWVSLYVSLTGRGSSQIAGTVSTSLEKNQVIVKVVDIIIIVFLIITAGVVIFISIHQEFESSYIAVILSSLTGACAIALTALRALVHWALTRDRNSYIVIFYDQILWIRKNIFSFFGAPKFIITCSNLPEDKPFFLSTQAKKIFYFRSGAIRCTILNTTKQTIEDILANISL